MRMKYIAQIQGRLRQYRTIPTNKASSQLLDGSYRSVYKGRSMNFDELREYVVGDDIKDVDWKASARSQKLLVKQYIAEKKHNIMLVMDTNKRMLADTGQGQEKREVALYAAGTLAYLVNQNGDYTSAMYAAGELMQHFPFKTGLFHIENILEQYHHSVTMENTSDLNRTLEYITRHFRRKMILILVTDVEGIRKISDSTLKRLLVMHDVLVMQVSDAVMLGENVYNLEEDSYLPKFITEDKRLAKKQAKRWETMYAEAMDKLKRFGIAVATIHHTRELECTIIQLLEKHKGEKR